MTLHICSECGYRVKGRLSERHMERHKELHKERNVYRCKCCNHLSISLLRMREHEKLHCETCGATFRTKSNCHRHVVSWAGRSVHAMCGQFTKNLKRLGIPYNHNSWQNMRSTGEFLKILDDRAFAAASDAMNILAEASPLAAPAAAAAAPVAAAAAPAAAESEAVSLEAALQFRGLFPAYTARPILPPLPPTTPWFDAAMRTAMVNPRALWPERTGSSVPTTH